MARIDSLTVQKILDTADIVEVVGDFVDLKKRGSTYMGLCPFHNERTPSFAVSRVRGYCKCFSCGKGGNAVNFLMELQQMNYGEALRYLARKYNIELKEEEQTEEDRLREKKRERFFSLMQFAADYFHNALLSTPEAVEALKKAGISASTVKSHNVGYFAGDGSDFISASAQNSYNLDLLNESGLTGICNSESGDRFYILPAITVYGKSCGLIPFSPDSGRSLPDPVLPKQLYADDTTVGLRQARQAISKQGYAVMASDPLSLLAALSAGVENTVLTGGKPSTLKKFTNEIRLLLPQPLFWDGYKMMQKSLPFMQSEMGIRVINTKHNDTGKWLSEERPDTIDETIRNHSTDIVSFKLNKLSNISRTTENEKLWDYLFNDLIESIKSSPDSVYREICATLTESKLGIPATEIVRLVGKKN